jgi:predicted Zn-dependent protease
LVAVAGLRAALRQRRLPLHLRGKTEDHRERTPARETVASFRRLTLEKIQAAHPLRIKVITVQPGDPLESLSHRMAGVDRPAERFRVLNGLQAHAQVRVRDRVKVVVD